MTMYGRSDVNEITVSPGMGGCGITHRRGIVDLTTVDAYGRPQPLYDKVFKLECPACEQYLTGDPQWAKHEADTPLTPDEQRVVDRETQTGTVLMQHMAAAMADGAAKAIRDVGGPERIADHLH